MIYFLLAIALCLLLSFLQSPLFKGWFGEKKVVWKSRNRLDPAKFLIFDNVTIRDGNETTQIDHIYVSTTGVFVVETKNMSGWIFGGEKQAQWTQTIYRKKTRFQNPLRQNYRHTQALESLLGIPDSAIKSVIVFVGDAVFKTPLPVNVCTFGNYTEYINSFTQPVLSDEQVKEIGKAIEQGRLTPTLATHRAHVRGLQKRHRK